MPQLQQIRAEPHPAKPRDRRRSLPATPSGREPDAARLVATAGEVDLSYPAQAPGADERGHAAGGARPADLDHASDLATSRIDGFERRAHDDRVGDRGHRPRAAQDGHPVGAILDAAWPVLAALALCPLAALLAPSDPAAPLARAGSIGDFESRVGLAFEPAAAAWLAARPVLQATAEFFYFWVHLPATVGVLVWAWLERRDAFPGARRAFVLTQVAVVAANVVLPTAPPGMSAADAAGAADSSQIVYLLQSPFAAMPSGHVAFATFAAGVVTSLVRSGWIRTVAAAYLALVIAIVIVTGNHFWLDAAAGGAIAVVMLRLSLDRGRVARSCACSVPTAVREVIRKAEHLRIAAEDGRRAHRLDGTRGGAPAPSGAARARPGLGVAGVLAAGCAAPRAADRVGHDRRDERGGGHQPATRSRGGGRGHRDGARLGACAARGPGPAEDVRGRRTTAAAAGQPGRGAGARPCGGGAGGAARRAARRGRPGGAPQSAAGGAATRGRAGLRRRRSAGSRPARRGWRRVPSSSRRSASGSTAPMWRCCDAPAWRRSTSPGPAAPTGR